MPLGGGDCDVIASAYDIRVGQNILPVKDVSVGVDDFEPQRNTRCRPAQNCFPGIAARDIETRPELRRRHALANSKVIVDFASGTEKLRVQTVAGDIQHYGTVTKEINRD